MMKMVWISMPKDFKRITGNIKRVCWLIWIALFVFFYVLNTVFPGKYNKPLGLVVGAFLYFGGGALLHSKMKSSSSQVQDKSSKLWYRDAIWCLFSWLLWLMLSRIRRRKAFFRRGRSKTKVRVVALF